MKKILFTTLLAVSNLAFSQKYMSADVYADVYQQVELSRLQKSMMDMTGYNEITVAGQKVKVTDRYSPTSKANFRAYWREYFEGLGMKVSELAYNTRHSVGETQGHDLEAVLPGKSADSIVIIVHYDSMGPRGRETQNPGVDDDMTGMAVSLETARLLVQYKDRLQHSVRFVAADYEEHGALEGARVYAKYISNLAKTQGFRLVGAIDNEQIGWNCYKDNRCLDSTVGTTFDSFTCSGDYNNYNFPELNNLMDGIVHSYTNMQVNHDCIGQNSDHYAMWEIGVPAIVYSEHQPFYNPHFDQQGGDTLDKMDFNYYFSIAKVGVVLAAKMVGIE